MTITQSLRTLLSGVSLSRAEASLVMNQIMSGECTSAQIAGWLIALRQKGETAEEIAGFVDSMRHHAVAVKCDDANVVDGCGTGGDGSHSFNVSTAAAIIAAGEGVTVAKHGNRSVSSSCGSADLLEATGGKIDLDKTQVEQCLRDIGFGFLFAPRFHPAMKHAIGPRKELGVRTVFNILGPMTNPAAVRRQVIGVYDPSLMPLMASVLLMTGTEHALLVHSQDGLDEFSVCATSDYVECRNGEMRTLSLEPRDAGVATHPRGSLAGGDARENLGILMRVLIGEAGPCRDAAVLNAGAMRYVAGKAESIAEGTEQAKQAIYSGRARKTLDTWIAMGNT